MTVTTPAAEEVADPPHPVGHHAGTAVAVGLSVGLAALLALHHLGTKPLWLDEAVSVSVASRPLSRLLAVLAHHDANAGLYYLLLHGWMRLGQGAAWDREPSALCFVASAGLAAWVGSRWRGPAAGAAWGVLMATNPFLLFYGQEARPYALAVLLAVASTAALLWRDGEPAPAAYVVATTALLYADLFALLFVVAQVGVVIVASPRRRPPPALVRCWGIIGGATAPLALVVVLREGSQISWLSPPSAGALEQTFTGMAGGALGLAVMIGLAGAAIVLGRRAGGRDRLVGAVLVSAFAVPPVLLWLFSQAVPSFVSRYVICSTVALTGVAMLGLDAVRRRAGLALGAAVLAGLALIDLRSGVRSEGQPFKYEDPPAVTAFITDGSQPGDAIGFGSGGLRMVLDDYAAPGRPLPVDVALAPGGEAWRQHDLYGREVSPTALATRLAAVRRLWLVTDPTDHRYPSFGPFAPLRSAVLGSFRPVEVRSFPGMDVTLYVR